MNWVDFIGIALFANFVTGWFEPLNPLREKLIDKAVRMMVKCNMMWLEHFISVFYCPMCLAFWASLLYTRNFTSALITSFMAVVFNLIITLYSYVKREFI